MPQLAHVTGLVVEVCWCGTPHAISKELSEHAAKTGAAVYCPLGHTWVVRESDADKQRKRAEAAEARAASLLAQIDQEKAAHASTKGQLTKTKKRIGKGVCPCCNRHFTNVERHMKTQHPEAAA